MRQHSCSRFAARFARLFCASTLAVVCGVSASAQTAPVLLSEGTGATTRAVAYESVTRQAEPFTVNSVIPWGADGRTRVMLFAMNLSLLGGEGTNAVSADAQDGAGRIYPLKVEHVAQVPEQPWLYSVVVRLHDGMTDALGDVFVRISLHGVASNRVRFAVGQAGGGLSDSAAGASPMPAPATAPAPLPPLTPSSYAGPQSEADTVRFLEQASWGPTRAEIDRVKAIGFRAYLDEQFATPPLFASTGSNYASYALVPDDRDQGCPSSVPTDPNYNQGACRRDNYSMHLLQRQFFSNAMYRPDQLRQRVAFALHQILVVSGREIDRPSWMSPYLQILDRHAFGNYRQLLSDITLNPAMGRYLDTVGNTRTNPNENYAREILQLFSVGVDELNTDGTPKLDAQGNRIPTYTQDTVTNFARVFTGWNFSLTPPAGTPQGSTDYVNPLIVRNAANHDTASKTLLSGATLPAGQNAAQDLNAAIDNIFNHPNVGPFISKQLIQHLVTSNPSAAYVGRVATVFNNNRANPAQLRAVVEAILLDPEARGDVKTDPAYGRLREPVQLINNLLRIGNARSSGGTTTSDGYLNPQAASLDQDVFRPPTVFSYYQPDYVVPGADILGPAFGILSTSTTLRRANIVDEIIIRRISPIGNTTIGTAPNGTSLNISALEALGDAPDQMIEELNRTLMHGTMSAAMRQNIINATNVITTNGTAASLAAYKFRRAQTALYLVVTSPQYQIQR
jgi:uncharacterized protein (DUF1800 family)